jgi:dihydrofolate reductase
MRKLKLQIQLTIDGHIAGPNHEMDWMQCPWSEDISDYVRQLTLPIDTILLGRNLATGFIPHWASVAEDPSHEEYEGGVKFTNTPKVVFSKTMHSAIWDNTTIANGDLASEINALKNQEGGDIICYGGGQFISSLIKENHIDEYHLFINPSIIGQGMQIFHAVQQSQKLQLEDCRKFDCGIALLKYNKIQS